MFRVCAKVEDEGMVNCAEVEHEHEGLVSF